HSKHSGAPADLLCAPSRLSLVQGSSLPAPPAAGAKEGRGERAPAARGKRPAPGTRRHTRGSAAGPAAPPGTCGALMAQQSLPKQ
ncbi:hypothetical protein HGM15179_002684, partial [Zosterops borbonicus]